MREIEQALARAAEAIRSKGSVPEDVIIGLEQLRASVGRWLSTTAATLYVPAHGRWLVSPTGSHVDLTRRPTMRRIVAVLVEARLTRPGEAIPSAALIAAGWPGEVDFSEGAANRLRVTLCRLRQLGVGAALLTTSAGWMLDPGVPLTQESDRPLDREIEAEAAHAHAQAQEGEDASTLRREEAVSASGSGIYVATHTELRAAPVAEPVPLAS